MNRTLGLVLCLLLLAGNAVAQEPQSGQMPARGEQPVARGEAAAQASSSAEGKGGSATLQSGAAIQAELRKTLDARKAKVGDKVEARAVKDVKSDGQVVLPRGAKLLGRVTEAQARGQGQAESRLGLLFDRAVLKDGREMPLQLAIESVAAAQAVASGFDMSQPSPRPAGGGGSPASGGGLLGGVGSTVGATTATVTDVAGGVGATATSAVGATTGAALGAEGGSVVGLPGLRLESGVSSQSSGSLSSREGNVRLESGTQLNLRVAGQP
jgi:hypothetical protein